MSEFDALPPLLRRKDVLKHFSISKDRFYVMVHQHPEMVIVLPGCKYQRIKKDVLVGLTISKSS